MEKPAGKPPVTG